MLHTELFTEWLANNGGADNALPALFSQVPDIVTGTETTKFSDAFILNFCDREIGFETEALFALKFEGRAKLVLPPYISKLKTLSGLSVETATDKEEITHSGTDRTNESLDRTTTSKNLTTGYNLPDAGATGTDPIPPYASEQTQSDGTVSESGSPSSSTTYGQKVTTTKSLSKPDTLTLIERLEEKEYNVWQEIFKKFDSLFMGVI